jgi:hypothetical protein
MGFIFKVVFIIKCRYNHCKNNNEVNKEDAIKVGSAYYCKQCYKEKILKQQIEEYYLENFPPAVLQVLRKVINQLLYTNNYDAEYILFIVKKIHINNLKINNPFGLTSYCNEGRNKDEWKKQKIKEEYNNIKKEIIQYDDKDKLKFTYKPNKKWTDLI